MGKLFLMVSMATEILFTVIFFSLLLFSKAIADLQFITKCCWQVPDVDAAGPWGLGAGALRVIPEHVGSRAPGADLHLRQAGPPDAVSLQPRASLRSLCACPMPVPAEGGIVSPALVVQLQRAPLCPPHLLPKTPQRSGQMGRSQGRHLQHVRGLGASC